MAEGLAFAGLSEPGGGVGTWAQIRAQRTACFPRLQSGEPTAISLIGRYQNLLRVRHCRFTPEQVSHSRSYALHIVCLRHKKVLYVRRRSSGKYVSSQKNDWNCLPEERTIRVSNARGQSDRQQPHCQHLVEYHQRDSSQRVVRGGRGEPMIEPVGIRAAGRPPALFQ